MEVLQDTYKDTKIGRIPKDWQVLKINKVADCYGGTTPSTAVEEYWNGDVLWATPSDITKNKSEFLLDTNRKITEQGRVSKNLRFVQKNGLLMTSRASIGFLNISNGDVVTNQGFINIECKANYHYKFFYYWILDNRKKLLSLSQGSTFLELNRKTFAKINIPFPPLPEQQKIAAILSTVDEQIITTDKIIEKSKELKKGLMQKLFSEGIGHTEFKDTKIGRIPKDWEVVRFGELIESNCYGPRFSAKDYLDTGNVKTIRGTDINKTGDILYTQVPVAQLPEKLVNTHKLKDGDLVMITTADCGLTGVYFDDGFPYIPSAYAVRLTLNQKALPLYFKYVFQTNLSKKQVIKYIRKGTVANLPGSDILKFTFAHPPLPEQEKIADLLLEADAKIEKEQAQKAQLEQLKKGLMQQLLTGKKRVKV